MMTWVWSRDEPPPIKERVLALDLYDFDNADWRWGQPYIFYELWLTGTLPTVWMRIEQPPVPDTPARGRARKIGRDNARIKAEIAKLQRRLR